MLHSPCKPTAIAMLALARFPILVIHVRKQQHKHHQRYHSYNIRQIHGSNLFHYSYSAKFCRKICTTRPMSALTPPARCKARRQQTTKARLAGRAFLLSADGNNLAA